MKKSYIMLFLITLFMLIFTFSASTQFVQVTSEYANIRPIPDTDSITIGEAFENNIFQYEGEEEGWIKIKMFSGEHRYIHHSLVEVINGDISISFSMDGCQSLMKKFKEAEKRSVLVSNHKYPSTNSENEEKKLEFQKILLDRYILEVFQEYNLQPAAYNTILSKCIEETLAKTQEGPAKKIEAIETDNKGNNINFNELSEEIRKEIFREMVQCEDWADIEAMQYYFPGCEDCAKFIETDIDKYIAKFTELTDKCKEKLKNKYNITEEIMLEISAEALEKGWAKPTMPPIPDCCR